MKTQRGQIIETATSFSVRYYVDGKQKSVLLCQKSAVYRTKEDVEPLRARVMEGVNQDMQLLTGQATLSEFFERCYLPWVQQTKAASTAACYTKLFRHIAPTLGTIALSDLTTPDVTKFLTRLANNGLGGRSIHHLKWLLSGIFNHAVSLGVVAFNPVPKAKALVRTERRERPMEYSLPQVLQMIAILTPIDLRAAVAVALCYFAALRPAEARGLKWEDWTGDELTVRRSIWRGIEGRTKTPESRATVPVIEPLRGLLEKLHGNQAPSGYILVNSVGRSLDLDTLSTRVIRPAMQRAGLPYAGFYPGRRGISSLVTDTSKNALNSTGLLRHSDPATALSFYTRPQKASVEAALKVVEGLAQKCSSPTEETIQ